MSRGIWAIIALLLFFGILANLTGGIHNVITDDETQNFAGVSTAGGLTSANVTLLTDPLDDKASEIESITSSLGTGVEIPVATAYETSTNTLSVGALSANTTRTLTVNYYVETEDQFISIVGPYLNFGIVGGILFFIGYALVKGKH